VTFEPAGPGDETGPADAPVAAALRWLADAGLAATNRAGIWATVELERALRERGLPAELAATAVADDLLGARVVLVESATPGAQLAIAEPSTEGRLAATLARHDEGPAGWYLAVSGSLDAIRAAASSAAIALSSVADGPFGDAVLVVGPRHGPYAILVDAAAVPSRP
jgi:hypothetical protein